jgi:hypothetical protein
MNTTTSSKKPSTKSSKGKPNGFKEIFNKIRLVMKDFTPPLKAISDNEKSFEIVSDKQIVFMGKKRDNVYFAATKIQKGFVGFYLMHIYAQPGEVDKLGKDLRKLLHGKSCFHIKKIDDDLLIQIKKSLADGIECYKRLKFI